MVIALTCGRFAWRRTQGGKGKGGRGRGRDGYENENLPCQVDAIAAALRKGKKKGEGAENVAGLLLPSPLVYAQKGEGKGGNGWAMERRFSAAQLFDRDQKK